MKLSFWSKIIVELELQMSISPLREINCFVFENRGSEMNFHIEGTTPRTKKIQALFIVGVNLDNMLG